MIISDKFAIAHFPKCGGHFLKDVLAKLPEITLYDHRDYLLDSKQKDSTSKHIPPYRYFLTGLRVIIPVRRLPSWYLSMLWQEAIHTRTNINGKTQKFGIGETYSRQMEKRRKQCSISKPQFSCHSTYPDYRLNPFLIGQKQQLLYIRQEYLVDDLYQTLSEFVDFSSESIELLKNFPKDKYSYGYNHNLEEYWTKESLEILYKNNPRWEGMEKKLYGNIFTL